MPEEYAYEARLTRNQFALKFELEVSTHFPCEKTTGELSMVFGHVWAYHEGHFTPTAGNCRSRLQRDGNQGRTAGHCSGHRRCQTAEHRSLWRGVPAYGRTGAAKGAGKAAESTPAGAGRGEGVGASR